MHDFASEPTPFPDYPRWRVRIAEWAALWGTPGLEARIELTVSTRLRRSLGRCTPGRAHIRLAAFLAAAPGPVIDEILCHEAAHVAVHELHPGRLRPHGVEWRALMRQAGFEPRATLRAADLGWLPAGVVRPARRAPRRRARPHFGRSRLSRRLAAWLSHPAD